MVGSFSQIDQLLHPSSHGAVHISPRFNLRNPTAKDGEFLVEGSDSASQQFRIEEPVL
jgi:hypothetical protein